MLELATADCVHVKFYVLYSVCDRIREIEGFEVSIAHGTFVYRIP